MVYTNFMLIIFIHHNIIKEIGSTVSSHNKL